MRTSRLWNQSRRSLARRSAGRSLRLAVEVLEDRCLLSGFARIMGELETATESNVLAIQVTQTDFTIPNRRLWLGFEMHAADGSLLDPGRISVQPQRHALFGLSEVETLRRRFHSADHESLALVGVRPGDFRIVVRGEHGTTGAYQVDAFLVGDANGDQRVDRSDVHLIHALRGERLGRTGYVPDADANRDGIINAVDEVLARANRGASTRIRPLDLTLELADIDTVTGQVTLRGQTNSGASVELDQGPEGAIQQSTTADAGGIYGFVTILGAGLTQLRVEVGDTFGQMINVTAEIFRLDVQLDSTAAVSQPVGPDGGTLTTTTADGTTYTLVIPPGAILSEEIVTMTPVAAIPNLPLDDGLIAAAQFGPDELQLFEPATLTIEVPGAVDASQIVGFGYQGSTGGDFYLSPAQVNGSTITLQIDHFSGRGAGRGTPNLPLSISSLETRYLQRVRPALMLARSLVSIRIAVDRYTTWREDVAGFEVLYGDSPDFLSRLEPRRVEGDQLAARALRTAVGIEMEQCDVAPDLETALGHISAIYASVQPSWWLRARALRLDTSANELNLTTLRENATSCVRIKIPIGGADFLRSQVAGQPARLTVSAGLSVAGRSPPDFVAGVRIEVERSSGIQESGVPRQFTDGQGNAVFTVTPVSDDAPVEFEVVASYTTRGNAALVDARITVIGDAVRISPSSASLAPGGSQQFSAEVVGLADQSVTWTASGGTISNTGLFTAGSTAGNFTVTATSVADPSKRAEAGVTVSVESSIYGVYDLTGTFPGGFTSARLFIDPDFGTNNARHTIAIGDPDGEVDTLVFYQGTGRVEGRFYQGFPNILLCTRCLPFTQVNAEVDATGGVSGFNEGSGANNFSFVGTKQT